MHSKEQINMTRSTHVPRLVVATAAIGALLPILALAQDRTAESRPAPRVAPAPPPPAPRSTKSTTSLRPDYRLTPGDKLRIEVYKDAQLSQSVEVRPDGKI